MKGQLSRSIPLPVRFGMNIEKQPSGCWVWMGSKYGKGYGKICMNGRNTSAHRVSWMLNRGPIPDGLCVLHKCDNPPCVNPKHLFIGTLKDNAQDCVLKGRKPDRGYMHQGERSAKAKLTNAQVLEMRRLNTEEGVKAPTLAKQFGINVNHCYDILYRVCWKHI